jgi:hypothetical protein
MCVCLGIIAHFEPWQGLNLHRDNTTERNADTSIPQVEFEHTIPVLERSRTTPYTVLTVIVSDIYIYIYIYIYI